MNDDKDVPDIFLETLDEKYAHGELTWQQYRDWRPVLKKRWLRINAICFMSRKRKRDEESLQAYHQPIILQGLCVGKHPQEHSQFWRTMVGEEFAAVFDVLDPILPRAVLGLIFQFV